ncbi:hypothetical protein DPMN_009311 [Dreissena polymorpha]|uniref:Uncharacterized protein n=1 Tax=Dreissena polymorpha TaxID=45954 RepID=A0A9D4S0H0_DREPO|nr:hypothetical protein DPMN_009311 [Dreissena polymorpha]
MGRTFERSDCSRQVDKRSEAVAHKLFGDAVSNSDGQTFFTPVETTVCFDSIRQSDCSTIHKSSGGNKVNSVMFSVMGFVELSNCQQYTIEGSTHCRKEQSPSRSIESQYILSNRVDIEYSDSREDIQNLGTTSDRSLCDKSKQKDITILQLVIPSTSVCNRHISHMGPNLCIRFSTNSSDTKRHETMSVSDHSNRTTLAKKVLVFSVTGTSHSRTNSTSCSGQSIITGRDSLSQCKKSQPDCMAIINKQFATKGFSSETRKLLLQSWRSGTKRDYSAKFRKFCSWCAEREIDTF